MSTLSVRSAEQFNFSRDEYPLVAAKRILSD